MLEGTCAVGKSEATKTLEEDLARKRARNMLLKMKIKSIKSKFSEDAVNRGAEPREDLDSYNFSCSDEDFQVKEQLGLVIAKLPCPYCGVEVIHLQSHMKRKHLEHYKKGKGGLKRKQKNRTTCFECGLSMDEVCLSCSA